MKVFVREREMRTAGGLTVSDITDEVVEAVADSCVLNGLACVYTPHTTCCIRINEWESGLFDDFIGVARTLARSTGTTHTMTGTSGPRISSHAKRSRTATRTVSRC